MGKPWVLAILPIGDLIVVGGSSDVVIDPGGEECPAKNIAVASASTGAEKAGADAAALAETGRDDVLTGTPSGRQGA